MDIVTAFRSFFLVFLYLLSFSFFIVSLLCLRFCPSLYAITLLCFSVLLMFLPFIFCTISLYCFSVLLVFLPLISLPFLYIVPIYCWCFCPSFSCNSFSYYFSDVLPFYYLVSAISLLVISSSTAALCSYQAASSPSANVVFWRLC